MRACLLTTCVALWSGLAGADEVRAIQNDKGQTAWLLLKDDGSITLLHVDGGPQREAPSRPALPLGVVEVRQETTASGRTFQIGIRANGTRVLLPPAGWVPPTPDATALTRREEYKSRAEERKLTAYRHRVAYYEEKKQRSRAPSTQILVTGNNIFLVGGSLGSELTFPWAVMEP